MPHHPQEQVAVIGLGYVGLPLALALAPHHAVRGYDVAEPRVAALNRGIDATGEVSAAELAKAGVAFSTDPASLDGATAFLITVPTPVDQANRPDLSAVSAAAHTIASHLRPGCLVVLESTVYPGVTEEVLGPILAAGSGLRAGEDFALGYSPERVNPGDKAHGIGAVTKVVAGQDQATTDRLIRLYGPATGGNLFAARSIKVAEAAKVIENIQRDINIAFVNEAAQIFGALGISIHDVLAAAGTKWNFLPFTPGLVGGHCVGVDPYYLADLATRLGKHPEMILAGRRINDGMAGWIARRIAQRLVKGGRPTAQVLVLGLTFKEGVPDLRNSKVVDLIDVLRAWGHRVDVHDPLADPAEAARLIGQPLTDLTAGPWDAAVLAVPHALYRGFDADAIETLVLPGGLVADIKGVWRALTLAPALDRWSL
jgi:UDP-N-acetyl-D-galactosamine dehydrogenase